MRQAEKGATSGGMRYSRTLGPAVGKGRAPRGSKDSAPRPASWTTKDTTDWTTFRIGRHFLWGWPEKPVPFFGKKSPLKTSVFCRCMPTLTADHVGHHFGRLLLFRELSLTLHAGETLAVTGANGSGKSTLLRILAGLLTPRTGTVTLAVDGDSVSADEHPLRTGLVAPAVGVYEELTARETLRFLADARRIKAPASRIDEVLARVGLTDRAEDRVETYSSGMRQRVKYAAALLSLPPLLLLDEPVANLDAAGREMVASITEAWRAQERLLVVATNRPDEAERHDRRLRIEDHR